MLSFEASPDTLQIRHVRVNGAADGLRTRLRFEAALADISSASLGLPPGALLIVKRVAPTARLRLARSVADEGFGQVVRTELKHNAKQASRPWLNSETSGAEAVLFADESELMACLLRDWLRGTLASHWWWQSVLGGLPVSEWWRRAVLPRGELLPAVLSQLATQKLAVVWIVRLHEAEVSLAIQSVVVAHSIPSLSAWLQTPPLLQTSLSEAAAYQHVVTLIPELQTNTLTIAQRRLLALALGLQRAAVWTRSSEFLSAVQAVEAVSETCEVLKTSQVLECNDTVSQLQTFPFVLSGESVEQSKNEWQNPEPDVKPSMLRPFDCSTGSQLMAQHERLNSVSKTSEETQTCEVLKTSQVLERNNGITQERATDCQPYQNDEAFPDKQTLESIAHSTLPDLVNKTCEVLETSQVLEVSEHNESYATDCLLLDSAETPLSVDSTTSANNEMASLCLQGISTQFGGIFYLLNVALALELYGDFTQPRATGIGLSPWDWLALIGRAWFGSAFEQDSVWRLLAELAGRSSRQSLGGDFLPPDSWVMPVDWFLPWGDVDVLNVTIQRNRLQLWHTAGFVITDVERETKNTPLAQARNLCLQHEKLGEVRLVRVYRQLQKTNSRSKLRRWLNWQLLYLHARLKRALHDDTPDALARLVCCHAATLYCTATTLDVYLSLNTLPIELRIAGLDRNPGWIPTAGRTIAFHFQ